MSRKHNTEKMLLRLFRVAEILAKAKSDNSSDPKIVKLKLIQLKKPRPRDHA